MYNIIANLLSGKGDGKKCLEAVKSYLNSKQIEFQIDIVDERGAGKKIAERICKKGSDAVIAIGGDGTFHEVLNGMDFSKARLGFIPAGRGNDFANGIGLCFDPAQAIASIIKGEALDLDYIQVGNKRCLNVCGTGLDVEVLKIADSKKKSYTFALANMLLNFKPYKVRVEACGRKTEYECVMAALCNGPQYGGGIKVCPPAKADDGLLNLIIMQKPKMPTLFAMPSFTAGKHMKKPYTIHVACETAKIINESNKLIQLDGEIYEDDTLDAKIVKGGLKTFAIQKL